MKRLALILSLCLMLTLALLPSRSSAYSMAHLTYSWNSSPWNNPYFFAFRAYSVFDYPNILDQTCHKPIWYSWQPQPPSYRFVHIQNQMQPLGQDFVMVKGSFQFKYGSNVYLQLPHAMVMPTHTEFSLPKETVTLPFSNN